jgi:DNA-directed RNA polymerase specialized sigma24 family protein
MTGALYRKRPLPPSRIVNEAQRQIVRATRDLEAAGVAEARARDRWAEAIRSALRAGLTHREVAKMAEVSVATVHKAAQR